MFVACCPVCLVLLLCFLGSRTIYGTEDADAVKSPSDGKHAEASRQKRQIPPDILEDGEVEMEPLTVDEDLSYIYPEKRPFRFLGGQPKRQPWGLILGGGYKLGKRMFGMDNRRDKYNKRPLLLGGGFKMGKRQKITDDILESLLREYQSEKRPLRLGDDYSTSESSEYFPDDEPVFEKRGFTSVLGGGYKFGRPHGGILKGYPHIKRHYVNSDDENDSDRYVKRLFGSRLGGGLHLGKRDDEKMDIADSVDETETDVTKRLFGHVLRGGFKLGKRTTQQDILEMLKNWNGSVRTHVPQNEVEYRLDMLRPSKNI